MRPQPITIKLGEAQWRVRPLTLRQVQEIEPFLLADPQASSGSVATAMRIVSIALSRDHPEAVEHLHEIEASVRDIGAAMSNVLQLGGFIARGEGGAPAGEAEAGVG